MGRAELATDARLPMRDHRESESRNKDAFLQQHVTHLDGRSRFPHYDGHDRSLALEGLEAGLSDRTAEIGRVVPEALHSFRVCVQEFNRSEGARSDRWRKRVGEQLRARPLSQHVAERTWTGDESTGGAAESLSKRRRDHINFAEHAEMLGGSASILAEHSRSMRIIHYDYCVVLPRNLENVGKTGDAPFHRKNPVGPDDAALRIPCAFQLGYEVRHVRVRIDSGVAPGDRFRQAEGVDDGGVIERIGENEVALLDDARRETLVRIPRRHIRQRGLRSDESRNRFLEPAVDREGSADESHAAGAGTVTLESVD